MRRDGRRPLAGLSDQLRVGPHRLWKVAAAKHELRGAKHDGHLVVHLVCHAACQAAHRLDALDLAEAILDRLSLRDVTREATGVNEPLAFPVSAAIEEHILRAAVMAPQRGAPADHHLSGENPAEHVVHHRTVGMEIGDVLAHVFRLRVPQHLQLGAIDTLYSAVGSGPVKADRRVLEELPDLALAPSQLRHGVGRLLRRLLGLRRHVAGLDRLVFCPLPLLVGSRRFTMGSGGRELRLMPEPEDFGGGFGPGVVIGDDRDRPDGTEKHRQAKSGSHDGPAPLDARALLAKTAVEKPPLFVRHRVEKPERGIHHGFATSA